MVSEALTISLPHHCLPTTALLDWISSHFATCIPTPLAFISTAAGILSIISNLFFMAPQVVATYRRGAVSDGVLPFLLCIQGATACDFMGALLLDLATWQKVSEGIYTAMAFTAVNQYLYYKYWKKQTCEEETPLLDQEQASGGQSHTSHSQRFNWSKWPIIAAFTSTASAQSLVASTVEVDGILLGKLLAIPPNVFFFSSRSYVLWRNFRRKSTEGLVPSIFIAALLGNTFYSIGLLTNPCAWNNFPAFGGNGWAGEEGCSGPDWLSRAAPYLLGALGTATLDVFVGMQYLYYGNSALKEH